MIRRVLGVLAGFLTFAAVTWLCEFSVRLTPAPQGAGGGRALAEHFSTPGMLLLLLSWAVGAFAGGFAASKISLQRWSALAVAAFGTMAGAAANQQLPPPVWFWILTFTAFLPPAMLGARLALPEK
ncbi:MAG TPA: hypothetical protein VH083_06165 [Myxococcales bacterium]|nr:hypothetical protein [Myxococcales bacterium]